MKRSKIDSNIKVLMYHRIVRESSANPADPHSVKADMFRSQLEILDHLNFTPVTFEDCLLYQQGRLTLPRKPIVITFDDGHLDTCEVAVPILQEFGMRAVIFVMGDRKKEYADWDADHSQHLCPLMSDQQIRDVRAEGFEIGAHSMTHRPLPELSEPELRREIYGSRQSIQQILGEEVISFAYPYGRLNSGIQEMVRQSGYRYGCGVYTGPPRFGGNHYDIRRLAIRADTGRFSYLLRMVTPFQYAEWLYGKIKSHNSADEEEAEEKQQVTELGLCHTNNP